MIKGVAHFSADETEMILRAVCLSAYWIAHAEDEDGEGDDANEGAALAGALKRAAEHYRESCPVIAEISHAALAARDGWAAWAEEAHRAEEAIQAALRAFDLHASEGDRKLFRQFLYAIARSVAQAHGEFGEDAAPQGVLGRVMGGLLGRVQASRGGHPMNVSAAETGALTRLQKILHHKD